MEPFVSVIIPCFNCADGLKDTLNSIAVQNYCADCLEVIVVDNNSTDSTFYAAESFKQIIPRLTVLTEKKQSSYAARNKAIEIAKGDVLVFIDADMEVDPDWIERGIDRMRRDGIDYLACRVDIYPESSEPNFWENYDVQTGFNIKEYMETKGYGGAGNIFVNKRVFNLVGKFDGRLISSGDKEFGNRVKDFGLKMFYDDSLIMRHPARSSFKSFINKKKRIGIGHADLKYFYPVRYGPFQLIHLIKNINITLRVGKKINKTKLSFLDKIKYFYVINMLNAFYSYGQFLCYYLRKVKNLDDIIMLK